MAPVVYLGPCDAVVVEGGAVCRRNIAADVDDALAVRLLERADFVSPDELNEAAAGLDPDVAAGDGGGAALPPLPDSAYPPDATPLDPPDTDTADVGGHDQEE